MFRIGDFSRLTQVTVKALRHYDSLGLLKPERIDPDSGYRYYSAAQLPWLNRILALKDLGFSLEQIGQLLDADLTSDQLRAMLVLKQDEVRDQIQADQRRLNRIEARLGQLNDGSAPDRYDVVVKNVGELPVVAVRDLLPHRNAVGRLFSELAEYQTRHRLNVTFRMTLWHESEYREQDVDAEAAFVTNDQAEDEERVVARVLPAVETMACVIHHGPIGTIGDGCQALLRWIEDNSAEINGPERVVLMEGSMPGPNSVFELQYPVSRL